MPSPILVIMGPTASGKSSLALETAARINGEIISADAFAVYRGMDIGTDKPSLQARRRVPHHLIDILEPDQPFSAGDFVEAADRAAADIAARRAVPVIAGGSHFYIRSLLFGLFPSPPHDPAVRNELEHLWDVDAGKAFERLRRLDPQAAEQIGPSDRQRVLRALEVRELTGETISAHWKRHRKLPRYKPLLIVPKRSRDELYARINSRVEVMFAGGLVEEVQRILTLGIPPNTHSLKAIGYREVVRMLLGQLRRDEAIEQTQHASRKLAKRQLAWVKGRWEEPIHWVPPAEQDGVERVRDLWENFYGKIPDAESGSGHAPTTG